MSLVYSVMLAIIIILSSFLVSLCLTKLFVGHAWKYNALDIPNIRSSHTTATPKGGGIVFASIFILVYIFSFFKYSSSFEGFYYICPSIIAITILGYLDDKCDISIKSRILTQIVVSLLLTFYFSSSYKTIFITNNIELNLLGLGGILVYLLIIWSINLFNFMDGIDGIAVIQAISFLSGWVILSLSNVSFETNMLIFSLIGGLLGFLIFNWPPAKVFMGGAGSYFLGLMIPIFIVMGCLRLNIPLVVWMILYGAFWFDATVTLIRRIIRKEKWYLPHRAHAYQRLQDVGWSHKKILVGFIILESILLLLAITAKVFALYSGIIFLLSVIILALIYWYIELLSPMKNKFV